MSRYRKIDPRFWKDEKIINLSPKEKLITLYLFTGQSNRIGIFNFSPGEAAEDLGLSKETFREGFGKVSQGLRIGWDETFRVLYLPTWWKYNCPENPNVLKSCLADLHEVPETSLIIEFSNNLRYLPETFHQTFREGLPKPSPQRMPHQEQEQEQEYKSTESDKLIPNSQLTIRPKDKNPNPKNLYAPRPARAPKDSDPRIKELTDTWAALYLTHVGTKYHFTAKDFGLLKSALRTFELPRLKELAAQFFDSADSWVKEKAGFTVGVFHSKLNSLASMSNQTGRPELKVMTI